jgi:hypothetical protein
MLSSSDILGVSAMARKAETISAPIPEPAVFFPDA